MQVDQLYYLYSDILSTKDLTSEYFVYLQHITNNSYAPHICSKTYCVKVDNFWCNKLWCPKENLKFLTRIILSRQSKVNYFYSVSCSGETKYIFRLKTRNIIIYFYCNLNILKRLGLVIGRIVKIPYGMFWVGTNTITTKKIIIGSKLRY